MIAQLRSPSPPSTFLSGYDLPPVAPTSTRVILLRHGRSDRNDAGCYQGSSDVGQLTPSGLAASQAIGRYLAHCPIQTVYVSPLRRAKETAAALLTHLTTPTLKRVSTHDLLREISLPAWEGLRYEDVRSHQSAAYHTWQTAPHEFQMQPERGEPCYPVRDLYQRAQQFWHTTLPHHRGQTILIVSHGGTNQALINTALQRSAQAHHSLQQTHSGLTVFDVDATPHQPTQLHLLNLTLGSAPSAIVTPRLPKLKAGKQGVRLVLLPYQPGLRPDPTLASLLRSATIQAAVVEDCQTVTGPQPYACHHIAKSVLTHNPETVVLSVQRSHFWQQWQAAISQSLQAQSTTDDLTTLLAVTQPDSLQAFLNHLLDLPAASSALALQPNKLSVIHYPDANTRPILQAVNLTAIAPHHPR
ncbi:MAG: histidine phosphatase family protein [Cyanobacteria bacterium P01_D01_bin.115]